MKVCTRCEVNKDLLDFSKNSSSYDGYNTWCKVCYKEYSRAKPNVINIIYNMQVKNSKDIFHLPPTYTKQEFYDWLIDDWLFNLLYDNWSNCGHIKDMKPSIDRIDDYKGYSFNNVQVMTWLENNNKYRRDKKNGISNQNNIAVVQLDKIGNIINEFHSISEAHRITNISRVSIGRCCDNKYGFKSAGGYIWKYAKA